MCQTYIISLSVQSSAKGRKKGKRKHGVTQYTWKERQMSISSDMHTCCDTKREGIKQASKVHECVCDNILTGTNRQGERKKCYENESSAWMQKEKEEKSLSRRQFIPRTLQFLFRGLGSVSTFEIYAFYFLSYINFTCSRHSNVINDHETTYEHNKE